MKEYLIDIGKDKENTIAECIYIGKQKIVLLPKFRKNQKEAVENALMHDKDSSTDNVFYEIDFSKKHFLEFGSCGKSTT
jgi:hypothetical protein